MAQRWQSLAARACELHQRGELQGAIEGYRRAVELEPGVGELWYNLGCALRRCGLADDARRAYGRAVALKPRDAGVWNNYGLALRDCGALQAAMEAYRMALVADHSSAAPHVNLGNALRDAGDRDGSAAAYRAALAVDQGCVAALYNLHASVYSEADPETALGALECALELDPEHVEARFYLGALQALHFGCDRGRLASLPPTCAFLSDSLAFVERARTPVTRLFSDTFETLQHGWRAAREDGLVVELGVRAGTSLTAMASWLPDETIHGFDAFEGLPEDWGGQRVGLYSMGGRTPAVPANAQLHVGWFADTLPPFVAAQSGALRFANVDCDLYSSTVTALEHLGPRVGAGTVFTFDEYLCNPGWQDGEHKAFVEAAARHGWRYEYIAFSLFTKQATVRIVG